jgi:2-oxoglutarate dehydrogenase E1 component
MTDYSYVFKAHSSYIDEMYQKYQADPTNVEDGWRAFFQGFEFGDGALSSSGNGIAAAAKLAEEGLVFDIDEFKVIGLINGYRRRGHLLSHTNPIRERRDRRPHLDLEDYGLTTADLDRKFFAAKEINFTEPKTLREIIERLHQIYCGSIGLEYFYISEKSKRRWLREHLEAFSNNANALRLERKKRILEKLNGAVLFEKFLHTKYVGQKRFSLEGGESTIPALDAIINAAANAVKLFGKGTEEFPIQDVEEVVIGMAHRGRLNVLANIMGKTYEHIFNEFEAQAIPDLTMGDGDVKYHLGYSSYTDTLDGNKVHLKLVPNPSHLEAADPVVQGFTRAKADILYKSEYDRILPILIHGDAAIAGQGIVYEVAQMSQLEGYRTGGTIHFVINNQVGFTTDFDDARSSHYCTSVASIVEAPVIHVNGDDPEAVVIAAILAVHYRQRFNSDIYIDMVCYRRHGHNEGDDPQFTQPEMYKFIKDHENPKEIYSKQLIERGDVQAALAQQMDKEFWSQLQDRLDNIKENPLPYYYQEPEKAWKSLKERTTPEDFVTSPSTGVDTSILQGIVEHLLTIPKDFKPLAKINRLLKTTSKLIENNTYDWQLAELMAYGSILLEGKDVRMSGQDVKRGTFSHRHAILVDSTTNEQYNRLNDLREEQGEFRIFNSLLSEFAVLGFEFGYSLATPDALVLWEAQFGDFANGAQVMVDQFISSSESKWQRSSGLVMLLPHGYEGQGPEHSSAKLERYLQLCAEFNMTVANITKPANFFHLLRRQLERPFRKPLIVMSPKKLLRYPLCVSPLEDFATGTNFQEVYGDPSEAVAKNAKKVRKVLWCSGKIYYDLLEKQQAENIKDIAICRIEQLYPFPHGQFEAENAKYPKAKKVWVQEEPENMGAWQFMLSTRRKDVMDVVSRKASASPSTGHKKVFDMEHQQIMSKAFE